MQYCTKCGTSLEVQRNAIEWYCPHCKRYIYANPIPTAEAALFDEDGKVLLGRRTVEPNVGKLNLPGGFVDMDETLEQAVIRELNEELGLTKTEYSTLMYAGSRVDTHTQFSYTRQLLSVMFIANISHRDFKANDEVSELLWILPSSLTPEDMTNRYEYDHLMSAVALKAQLDNKNN